MYLEVTPKGGKLWHMKFRQLDGTENRLSFGVYLEVSLIDAREKRYRRIEPKPWELAMAARRREVMRELSMNAARLRQERDNELADQVDCFMRDMPPLDIERRQMQRALIELVEKRVKELGRERE